MKGIYSTSKTTCRYISVIWLSDSNNTNKGAQNYELSKLVTGDFLKWYQWGIHGMISVRLTDV